ncbi:MAG: hypothetical protein HEP71_02855 [Roseivirga sp.]|nr:hypothetical protein [Roseivirga sp.]
MSLTSIRLLISRQFKEQMRVYLIAMALLIGLLAFMFLLIHNWRDSFSGAVENGVFLIGLFLSGGLFTNSMFREFSNNSEGIWLLNIPATSMEKVVSAVLLSTVIFLAVYLSIFFLVDTLYLNLTGQANAKGFFDMFTNGFHEFILLYLIFNGLILLGRVSFVKHSFLKSMVVIIAGFVVLNTLNNFSLEYMIPDLSVTSSMPLSSFQFRQSGENIHVQLPAATQAMVSPFLWTLTPLFLWGITWLKIKEKEI